MPRVIRQLLKREYRKSYAQCGEDLIVDFLLKSVLQLSRPSYLDLGAHHPTYLSNTYYFYCNGSSGVCVEPNPTLFQALKRKRKRDVCLNCGVATTTKSEADFYILSAAALSTFSHTDARMLVDTGKHTIRQVAKVPLLPITEILDQWFERSPDFLSIDTEGPDLEILHQIVAAGWQSPVVCVETLTYSENNMERKKNEIVDFMCGHGYQVYADTWINTIFVSTEAWVQR